MKHSFNWLHTALFVGSMFVIGCKDSGSGATVPVTHQDTIIKDTISRSLDVRNMSAEDVFLRIPKHHIEMEGLEKLDEKARKELLSKGEWGGYKLIKEGNWITLLERTQNDDDPSERTNRIQLAIFTQKERGNKQVLLLKHEVQEDDKEWESLLGRLFLEWDGMQWNDISPELAVVTTKDFFKPEFDLKGTTKDFIRYELSKNDPHQIKASLLYHLYPASNKKVTDKYLIDNEAFAVSLYWNGETLNLVKEPLDVIN